MWYRVTQCVCSGTVFWAQGLVSTRLNLKHFYIQKMLTFQNNWRVSLLKQTADHCRVFSARSLKMSFLGKMHFFEKLIDNMDIC